MNEYKINLFFMYIKCIISWFLSGKKNNNITLKIEFNSEYILKYVFINNMSPMTFLRYKEMRTWVGNVIEHI